jgi:hypothetical protein
MKEQMTGSEWRGRRAGRLMGALGLLLAAVLAVGLVPAYAQNGEMPPALPHYFAGTASSSSGPVPEGTAVEAWVEGAKRADTSVTAQGTYDFLVPGEHSDGTEEKIVSFTVGGIQASQTYPWVSGCITLNFDLTIPDAPNGNPFPFPLPCFVATAAYGTGTAEEIDLLREFRDVVLLTTDLGTELVSLYYQVSPAIAEVVSQHEFLRTAVRAGFVDPITAILDWSHSLWTETYE